MNDTRKTREVLKQLPSIDKLLKTFKPKFPLLFRPLLKKIISEQLEVARLQVLKNKSQLNLENLHSNIESKLILALRPNPVLTACSIQYRFITGSIPGKAESTKLTCVFGLAPNFVDEPENSFDSEIT